MSKIFLKRGPIYTMTEGNFSTSATLDDGIYQVEQNPLTGELFLERIGDKFNFEFKLYGLDDKLVTHVLNTYNKQETKRNIGVLLNGAKGTGKTVTAKYLCNQLGLPVIICDCPYKGLALFLAQINHDCIFLFDEFEKNFRLSCGDNEDCAGEDLLSIMDGVYSGGCCHIFILTTNELRVNDNLISRPSRIRYLKSFDSVLDRKIAEEFIDDNLKYPEYKDEILEFVEGLTMVSIDIVKSIVDEINLHHCGVDEFKRFFNIKEAKYTYYTRTWSFNKGDRDEEFSKEAFLRELAKPYSAEKEFNPPYGSMTLNKCIKKYKPGQLLYGSWIMIEMDENKHYILARSLRYPNNYQHILIENPEAKPSIYDSYSRNVTNYWGDGDDYWD